MIDYEECIASIPSDSSLDDFTRALAYATAVQRHSPWWIGDIYNELHRRFGDLGAQAFPLGVSLEMMQRYAGVCRRIPYENRNPNLSMSHHIEASRLPAGLQVRALEKAEHEGYNSADFRLFVSRLLSDTTFGVERLLDWRHKADR